MVHEMAVAHIQLVPLVACVLHVVEHGASAINTQP